jgi:peptidoglycan/LPS O-acetylase OafA/YrhL
MRLQAFEDQVMNRTATLDGWRGIAILLVLTEHAGQHRQFKGKMWARLGVLGVDIFFVLSGYIITARLIEERRKFSTISLSSFYVRRAFRILPLVAVYLATLFLLSRFIDLIDFHPAELAGSVFFRNYQIAALPRGIYTVHFWSLSIEEHFYLFWPALLVWGGNK